MLSKNAIERVLAQCEKVDKTYRNTPNRLAVPMKVQMSQARNEGWVQALQLVLKGDPKSIKNTSLKEKV